MNENEKAEVVIDENDKLSVGYKILSFLIPLAGLIIWGVRKKDRPVSSKQALVCAAWGFGISMGMKFVLAFL